MVVFHIVAVIGSVSPPSTLPLPFRILHVGSAWGSRVIPFTKSWGLSPVLPGVARYLGCRPGVVLATFAVHERSVVLRRRFRRFLRNPLRCSFSHLRSCPWAGRLLSPSLYRFSMCLARLAVSLSQRDLGLQGFLYVRIVLCNIC